MRIRRESGRARSSPDRRGASTRARRRGRGPRDDDVGDVGDAMRARGRRDARAKIAPRRNVVPVVDADATRRRGAARASTGARVRRRDDDDGGDGDGDGDDARGDDGAAGARAGAGRAGAMERGKTGRTAPADVRAGARNPGLAKKLAIAREAPG